MVCYMAPENYSSLSYLRYKSWFTFSKMLFYLCQHIHSNCKIYIQRSQLEYLHIIFFFLFYLYKVLTAMDNVIQETIQYTRQRKIFKQPVLYHQSVHFRLAELATEVELLRSLLYRATGDLAKSMSECLGLSRIILWGSFVSILTMRHRALFLHKTLLSPRLPKDSLHYITLITFKSCIWQTLLSRVTFNKVHNQGQVRWRTEWKVQFQFQQR